MLMMKLGILNTVTKVNGVLGTQYFCDVCLKGFHNRDKHKCKVWCNVCGRGNCEIKEVQQCSDCNRVCGSKECFIATQEKNKKW